MKANFFKFAAFALCAAVAVSCDPAEGGDDTQIPAVDPTGNVLYGSLTADRTLLAGQTYELSGAYTVEDGSVLTIQPGVTIIAQDDNTVDYILVEQGAKIMAQGTAQAPIVMTSELKEHGAWGGLHICGKAKINNGDGAEGTITGKSEIGNSTFGGNNDADNSGALSYVRIEYAGYAFNEDSEANGFSFYGVGNGTQLDHLQAYKGGDDGFEWFGGNVNAKYLVSTDNHDDSFDWTYGFRGTIQYAIAHQLTNECDNMIEGDSNKEAANNTVVSHVKFANVTFLGVDKDATDIATSKDNGVKIRRGCELELYNAIITGKVPSILVDGERTNAYVNANLAKFSNIYASSNVISTEDVVPAIELKAVPEMAGYAPKTAIAATTPAGFAKADFVGAVGTEDWTAGWVLK